MFTEIQTMIIDNHMHVAGPPHNEEPLSFSVYDGRRSYRQT